MSLTAAIQDNSNENITEEEKMNIVNYFQALVDHLSACGISSVNAIPDGSAGKLSKLSVHHLMELASDMCNEVDRRDSGSTAPLPSKPELTSKRNNARIRMAEFTTEKLNNLILDVVQEIDRRNIGQLSQTDFEDVKVKEDPVLFENNDVPAPSPVVTKKPKIVVEESKKQHVIDSPLGAKRSGFLAGMTAGIDSLNAMIEDLGSFIGGENNEDVEELKQKYEIEIQNLKYTIGKYENTVIPEKNREIAKLMAKIEEIEMTNARLQKELKEAYVQINNQENAINDQKIAYDNIKHALEKIETQIADRAINTKDAIRKSALAELSSSNAFAEINNANSQILNALGEMGDCISNFNQKQFLKLLKEIATAAKTFCLCFDMVLQVATKLEIGDLCEKGETSKTEYISALSFLLVSGKDFSVRPTENPGFKSSVEMFRSANESCFKLKARFEKSLKH